MIAEERRTTIFALSSGMPPAAIAVIRVSGPHAGVTLRSLAGRLPAPRRSSLRPLHDPIDGRLLDRALVLWHPGPGTATGEDIAELHCHGGRAVVAAVLAALGRMPGLLPAAPGEFTRRAFDNGRIDLAEAEGLADLLAAETEMQRRAAMASAEGGLSRMIGRWQALVLEASAIVEAKIEHEEDDATIATADARPIIVALAADIMAVLASPPAERIRDGIRVVIAGPPNAGKSTLLNALAGRPAALVSAIAGTTRDVIEAPVALDGIPFLLCDTAGLRDADDPVEGLGIAAAEERIAASDLMLWLGRPDDRPLHDNCIVVAAKNDLSHHSAVGADISISAATQQGLPELVRLLRSAGEQMLSLNDISLSHHQQGVLVDVIARLQSAAQHDDLLLAAAELGQVRSGFDRLTGGAGTDDMLGALFSRFCIGK